MAIAKSTLAQRVEAQRQLTIVAKDFAQLANQNQATLAYTGPAIDTKITALQAALAAIVAAA